MDSYYSKLLYSQLHSATQEIRCFLNPLLCFAPQFPQDFLWIREDGLSF